MRSWPRGTVATLRLPVEREVELEDVDALLAEEPERATGRVVVDEPLDVGDREAARLGDARRLQQGVLDRDLRVEARPRRGHRVGGHQRFPREAVLLAIGDRALLDRLQQ